MKYSHAMREGAKKGPQLFNNGRDGNGGTCAYWAMVAGGIQIPTLICAAEAHPFLGQRADCPADCQTMTYTNGRTVLPFNHQLHQVIIHLNNDHRWSREKIADWIEKTYERDLVPFSEIKELAGMTQNV